MMLECTYESPIVSTLLFPEECIEPCVKQSLVSDCSCCVLMRIDYTIDSKDTIEVFVF